MPTPIPFDYQEEAVPKIAELLNQFDSGLIVAPGGSGKSMMASLITYRILLKRQTGKVLFFTHRDELFNQIRERMLEFGIVTQGINQETTYINPSSRVFIIMVETFNRRCELPAFLANFEDTFLYHCDEAHRSDFNKIFKHFPNSKRLGWTATPISAVKAHPLKEFYQFMFEVVKVSHLHELNSENPKIGVVPIQCKFGIKGGEFIESQVSEEFRKKLQIDNVISSYFKLARGLKTLCFDADIEHSIDMMYAFKSVGINARHVNGGGSKCKKYPDEAKEFGKKSWRKDCLTWLKKTPDAVLDNVGILTTGFDEKSVEAVFINSSMLSKSLYIQKVVRVSRPYQYPDGTWKTQGLLLDFGNNAPSEKGGAGFGDTNKDEDWEYEFNHPYEKKREGVGGYKTCPNCSNLNPVSARFCTGFLLDFLTDSYVQCDYVFPISVKEVDLVPREMIKFYQDKIQVSSILIEIERNGYKAGSAYHKVLDGIVGLAKDLGVYLASEQISFLVEMGISKIKELGKLTGKKTFKESVKEDILKKLQEKGFIVNINEVNQI